MRRLASLELVTLCFDVIVNVVNHFSSDAILNAAYPEWSQNSRYSLPSLGEQTLALTVIDGMKQ